LLNAHYDSHETYVNAVAGEIAKEYRAIHEAGLILQVDAPDLAMERVMMFQDESDEAFREGNRNASRGDQQGLRGHPARSLAPACLLG